MKIEPSEPPAKRPHRKFKGTLANVSRSYKTDQFNRFQNLEDYQFIPSVNFHLWEPCNMRCKFCFATFQDVKQSILPKGHLPKGEALEVVQELASFGFQKITFAGGEPTLCPWLPELIAAAKEAGMITTIVTNGSKLTDAFLKANRKNLDWIALSIDSLNPETNLKMGRAIAGQKPLSVAYYKTLMESMKAMGFGIKINTVVNRANLSENMVDFICEAKPLRWKILQAIQIKGQNDGKISEFLISDNEFDAFIEMHHQVTSCTTLVPEPENLIKGSYVMVDPAGRFFDDASGIHRYSCKILEVGCAQAIQQIETDFGKFLKRGGLYQFSI